jgi:hypothetical protein
MVCCVARQAKLLHARQLLVGEESSPTAADKDKHGKGKHGKHGKQSVEPVRRDWRATPELDRRPPGEHLAPS